MGKEERSVFWGLMVVVFAFLAFGLYTMAHPASSEHLGKVNANGAPERAPDRVDARKALGKDAYCQMWGYFAARGAFGAYHGVPLAFKYVDPGQMAVLMELAEHGAQPKDAFYFKDDGLTDHEKEFWEQTASEGWHRMQEMMKAHPDMPEPDPQELVPQFFGICMQSNEI